MAHFYIEPRYNSGERVAGGKLAIYTNESLQNFCDLYRVNDFNNPVEGTTTADFLIENPVTIDNNGINTSPIFLDIDLYPEAYYVIYDVKGAVIRQGYLVPMSWQGGAQPPQGGDGGWGNALVGDPFWGYEVITGLNSGSNPLSEKATTIGRPLFLLTNVSADKSGGLVIYAVNGSGGDNTLTFAGNNGKIWCAREEFINYSYLAQTQSNPFQYIDSINDEYGYDYGIRLDSIPTTIQGYTYKGKLLIDSPLSGVNTTSQPSFINMIDSDNLQITGNAGINLTGSGYVPFFINVQSGQFDTQAITDQNGNNFIRGIVDCLRSSNSTLNLTDLTVKKFVNGNQPMNVNESSTNSEIYDLNSDAITWTGTLASSMLVPFNLRTLTATSNLSIVVDSDIKFEAKGIPGTNISLTGNLDSNGKPVGYYVKPSENWVADYKFYAKNAEFYNHCQIDSSVELKPLSAGAVPQLSDNRLIKIARGSYGTLKLNANTTGKLYIDSMDVDVIGNIDGFGYTPSTHMCYVKNAKSLFGLIARFDHNVIAGSTDKGNGYKESHSFKYNGMSTYCAHQIAKARNCTFNFGTDWGNWSSEFNWYGLRRGDFKNVTFNFDTTPTGGTTKNFVGIVSEGSKFNNCSFNSTADNWLVSGTVGNISTNRSSNNPWMPNLLLGNNTVVEGCSFQSVGTVLFGDGQDASNIDFNNNKATNAACLLCLWGNSYGWDVTHKCENVNFKGNYADENNNAFMIESNSITLQDFPLVQGHIEVTGYYDYLLSGGTGLATDVFPVKGKNITTSAQWNSNGEYISDLCLYVYGETLKYGNINDGVFVMIDPRTSTTTGGTPGQQMTQNQINDFMQNAGWNYAGDFGSQSFSPTWNASNQSGYTGEPSQQDLANRTFANIAKYHTAGNTASGQSVYNAVQTLIGVAPDTNNAYYFWSDYVSGGNVNSKVKNLIVMFYYNSQWYYAVWRVQIDGNTDQGMNASSAFNIGGTPGTTTYSWRNNGGIPRLRMTMDAWDSDGYGYTKTICCLLCCNCNIKLYRIRE